MGGEWMRRPSTLPIVLFIMAICIIIAGGTIRINDAGESCPDWPQCFGTWGFDISPDEQGVYWDENPDEIDSRGADHRYTTFEIFSEWFHRALVGVIAVPVLFNAILAYKMRDVYGSGVLKSSIASGILLIVQAIIGAVTVAFDNVDWSVALHLSMASIFTSTFVYQHFAMRQKEGVDWALFQMNPDFITANRSRVDAMTGAVFTLLILGAWVSSTAGGQYNQACSVGFPNGWPKCNGAFLPSFDGPGVLVQMVHRFGALIAGLILLAGSARLRSEAVKNSVTPTISRITDVVSAIWFLNLMVGASYLIFAKMDQFPETLSLLHLVIGVFCLQVALSASFFMRLGVGSSVEDEAE